MSTGWKPAYLVHGDDHGRIAERRAALRARAEAEEGSSGVELLEGEGATAEAVAAALTAMTLAIGRRFVLVDGAERWKAAEIHERIGPALAALAPETTVAFFAREDKRAKAADALVQAVTAAGGDVFEQRMLKAKELPTWAVGEARRLGVTLDGAAAQALISQVGDRQQRLLRELEKLAVEYGHGARIGVEEIEGAAHSSERQVWALGDAVVARDRRRAFEAYLELLDQGEEVGRLVPSMVRRVRDVHDIAERLERGESPQEIKKAVGGNPWALDHRIREARSADASALAQAIETLAQLELQTHGLADSTPDTCAVRAIGRITLPV